MKPTRDREQRTDWARALIWTPLVVGGVVAAVFATRSSRLRRAAKSLWNRGGNPRELIKRQEKLRAAILGNEKQTIADVLGPPRTALHRTSAAHARADTTADPAANFLDADSWYYPFDHGDQSAVVIEFEDGVARRAEFIQSPHAERARGA
jgi:hypothetical protein